MWGKGIGARWRQQRPLTGAVASFITAYSPFAQISKHHLTAKECGEKALALCHHCIEINGCYREAQISVNDPLRPFTSSAQSAAMQRLRTVSSTNLVGMSRPYRTFIVRPSGLGRQFGQIW